MPIKKAAFKALRKNLRQHQRHLKVSSDLAAVIRRVRQAVWIKDRTKAQDWLKQAIKRIDKAQQKGWLEKNTAGRKKSRLSRLVNSLKWI